MDLKFAFYCISLLIGFNLVALYQNFQLKILTKQMSFSFPILINLISYGMMFVTSTIILRIEDMRKSTGITVVTRLQNNMANVPKVFLLSFAFVTYQVTTLYGLYFISIPIYLAARRCQVLFVIFMHLLLCEFNKISLGMLMASLTISAATVGAILGDLENGSFIGYSFLIIGNFGSVFYAEISSRLQRKSKIGSQELLQQYCAISVLLSFPIYYFSPEYQGSLDFFAQKDTEFVYQTMICIFGFAVSNFVRQYLMFLCSKNMDTFVISISVNFKDIIGTMISLIMFNDINMNTQVVVSLSLSFIGAFGFAVYKFWEAKQKEVENKVKDALYENQLQEHQQKLIINK